MITDIELSKATRALLSLFQLSSALTPQLISARSSVPSPEAGCISRDLRARLPPFRCRSPAAQKLRSSTFLAFAAAWRVLPAEGHSFDLPREAGAAAFRQKGGPLASSIPPLGVLCPLLVVPRPAPPRPAPPGL